MRLFHVFLLLCTCCNVLPALAAQAKVQRSSPDSVTWDGFANLKYLSGRASAHSFLDKLVKKEVKLQPMVTDIHYYNNCSSKVSAKKDVICEEACLDDVGTLGAALGMQSGDCASQGFHENGGGAMCVGIHNITIWAPSSSNLVATGTFSHECTKARYHTLNGLCQTICTDADKATPLDNLATQMSDAPEGKCADHGYPKYLGIFEVRLVINHA